MSASPPEGMRPRCTDVRPDGRRGSVSVGAAAGAPTGDRPRPANVCPKVHEAVPVQQSRRSCRRIGDGRTIVASPPSHRGGAMPTYLSPGVYVQETDSGSRPIEGVGTAVAAFVGLAEKGPFNQPTLISNWTQFTRTFGGFIDGACLAESVFGYFQNGGGNSYIVRIGDGVGENGSAASQPQLEATPQGVLANYRVLALDPGTPPDSLRVEITSVQGEGEEQASALKLVVQRDGQVVEEFPNVSTARGKTNVATVVN